MRALIFLVLSATLALVNSSELLTEFAVGNGEFAADVYKELVKSNSGNFLLCPISAEIILSLVHAGAEGETAQELAAGLHLPENKEKIQEIMKELIPNLHGNENYTLSAANKVYVADGSQIYDHFKKTAVEVFEADIQNIDFSKKTEAAGEMNKWVEEKTHDKIKDLIKPDYLSKLTRSVLINAIYFHGKWAIPFQKENTQKRSFHLSQHDTVETDLMEITDTFQYHQSAELNAKFLELKYAGSDVTMTFVLPNNKEGLSTLESRIKDVFVSPKYSWQDVHVVLPKFKIETEIQLNPILQSLGIEKAFTDDAEFEEILVGQSLKISRVIQKTFIEVEEEGTTAAAATAVFMDLIESVQPPPRQFIADHPFIFYLKVKDVVLFAGRYTSPTN